MSAIDLVGLADLMRWGSRWDYRRYCATRSRFRLLRSESWSLRRNSRWVWIDSPIFRASDSSRSVCRSPGSSVRDERMFMKFCAVEFALQLKFEAFEAIADRSFSAYWHCCWLFPLSFLTMSLLSAKCGLWSLRSK